MLLLAGAVPIDKLPLLIGEIEVDERRVRIGGHDLPINRGNEAMMAAACLICQEYGVESPVGLVAGDIGKRDGSEKIYYEESGSIGNSKKIGFNVSSKLEQKGARKLL